MVKIIKIENRIVDNGHCLQTEHMADGGLIETYFAGDNAYQGKNTNPDGSFQIWRMINGAKVVTEEKTADALDDHALAALGLVRVETLGLKLKAKAA